MVLGGGTIRKIFILLFSLFIILIIMSNKGNDILILVNKTNPINEYNPSLISYGKFYIAKEAYEPLKNMIKDIEKSNIDFKITEIYVSVKMQQNRFDSKVKEYMDLGLSEKEAKMETAKKVLVAGYSEHHTGLALNFQGNDEIYNWLEENAYKYGFILRYPKDKEDITKYKYNKTHYRYVGEDNSKYMYNNNLCLEEYLKEMN